MKKIKFVTTLAECRKSIRGVCDGCGGKLSALRTVDNADNPTYWVGCNSCSKFTNGTDKRVWKMARFLVSHRNWKPYTSMNEGEYKSPTSHSYWLRQQTSGAVKQIYDVMGVAKAFKFKIN